MVVIAKGTFVDFSPLDQVSQALRGVFFCEENAESGVRVKILEVPLPEPWLRPWDSLILPAPWAEWCVGTVSAGGCFSTAGGHRRNLKNICGYI